MNSLVDEDRGGRPFADLRDALSDISHKDIELEGHPSIRTDPFRTTRTGIPEVVYAERKTSEEVWTALFQQSALTGRALASRCSTATAEHVRARLERESVDLSVDHDAFARTIVMAYGGALRRVSGGRVGIIAAGTSDGPFAAEAAVMSAEMGCSVTRIVDVGVAGLHRLVRPLQRIMSDGVDALVVVAGMDGVLPSVVTGLVDVPVIGLPTSTGYGFGGQGVGALTTMLQSCALGLTVVNVDNGIGAGAAAALIANRAAAARTSS